MLNVSELYASSFAFNSRFPFTFVLLTAEENTRKSYFPDILSVARYSDTKLCVPAVACQYQAAIVRAAIGVSFLTVLFDSAIARYQMYLVIYSEQSRLQYLLFQQSVRFRISLGIHLSRGLLALKIPPNCSAFTVAPL